jgi:hypothetical protein
MPRAVITFHITTSLMSLPCKILSEVTPRRRKFHTVCRVTVRRVNEARWNCRFQIQSFRLNFKITGSGSPASWYPTLNKYLTWFTPMNRSFCLGLLFGWIVRQKPDGLAAKPSCDLKPSPWLTLSQAVYLAKFVRFAPVIDALRLGSGRDLSYHSIERMRFISMK